MSAIESCRIWGLSYPATDCINEDPSYAIVDSPRAGGRYKFRGDARLYVGELDHSAKARLTTWLVDQRLHGVELPEVTGATVESVKTKPPLPVHERANRLLRFIANQMETVATIVVVKQETHAAYAWSESIDWDEVNYLLDYLEQMRWLQGQRSDERWFLGGLTVDGHSHNAEQRTNIDSSQAFVAMWLDDSMTTAYGDGIELGIRDTGYEPLRIDQKEHINKIDDEIIGEIRRSRFLVADFTHGDDGARGGVYYEAGFAHALNLPVIFTCSEDAVETLHFDTEHYNHILWTTPADLREKLKNRILAVIGQGPEI